MFHIGQITFEIPNKKQGTVHRYKYIGSLKGDKAFGQGFATRIDNERDFIIGTFKDNVPHGICRSLTFQVCSRFLHFDIVVRELLVESCDRRQTFATECRDGHSFGKLTRYDGDSEGSNYAFNVIMKSVEFGDSKKGSYYSKNGKAVKALNADWKQYSTQLKGYDEPVSV